MLWLWLRQAVLLSLEILSVCEDSFRRSRGRLRSITIYRFVAVCRAVFISGKVLPLVLPLPLFLLLVLLITEY